MATLGPWVPQIFTFGLSSKVRDDQTPFLERQCRDVGSSILGLEIFARSNG